MQYDTTQVALVEDARRVYWRGFRHRVMAGTIRNRLLRDVLRRALPSFSFHNGIVNSGDGRDDWTKDDLSNECDIIAHTGQPWEQLYEHVVVPERDAHFIIEVKNWIKEPDFPDSKSEVNKQVTTLRSQTSAPVYLVAYRHSGDRENLLDASVADGTFILASGGNGPSGDLVYPGVLERLIETLDGTTNY